MVAHRHLYRIDPHFHRAQSPDARARHVGRPASPRHVPRSLLAAPGGITDRYRHCPLRHSSCLARSTHSRGKEKGLMLTTAKRLLLPRRKSDNVAQEVGEDYFAASQWQLMWNKLKHHRPAQISMVILGLL